MRVCYAASYLHTLKKYTKANKLFIQYASTQATQVSTYPKGECACMACIYLGMTRLQYHDLGVYVGIVLAMLSLCCITPENITAWIRFVHIAMQALLAVQGARWTEAFRPKSTKDVPNIMLTTSLSLSLYLSISLSLHLSIPLSVYLSICLSAYLSISLSLYLSIPLSLYLSISLSLHLSISPSLYPSICLSVYLSICLSVYLAISLSLYPSVSLSLCLSISLSLCLSISLSLYLSICLSLYLSICLSLYLSISLSHSEVCVCVEGH